MFSSEFFYLLLRMIWRNFHLYIVTMVKSWTDHSQSQTMYCLWNVLMGIKKVFSADKFIRIVMTESWPSKSCYVLGKSVNELQLKWLTFKQIREWAEEEKKTRERLFNYKMLDMFAIETCFCMFWLLSVRNSCFTRSLI